MRLTRLRVMSGMAGVALKVIAMYIQLAGLAIANRAEKQHATNKQAMFVGKRLNPCVNGQLLVRLQL